MLLNLNFSPFPLLTTERLLLRSITKNDAKDLFRLRSDETVMQFIDRPRAKSLKDAEQYIKMIEETLKNNEGITWGISFKTKKQLIGTIGLFRIQKENFRAEIGYMLDVDFQRNGLMHEALQPIINYGFNVMNLHSMEAQINPLNIGSKKLLRKNHFVQEASFKENYFFDGKFKNTDVYSLLKASHKKLTNYSSAAKE